jgi:microsomal dipeptidase-like Zn-dependent dipeptidase
MGSGITDLGRQVLVEMLSQDNGPRILPDLKHMSGRAREEFYALRENGDLGGTDFPLLISHGACNGLKSFGDPNPGPLPTARLLNPVEINFYDSEIIALARSGGLIGLQLDERRIASKAALGEVRHSLLRHKIMHYRSELLWRQVRHIAETLDRAGLFAWDCMAIGSDFDGIIDSLNGFWTAEELPFLSDFLERHAYNYLKTASWNLPENQIQADQVVERIFSGNGHRFLKAHFRAAGQSDIV